MTRSLAAMLLLVAALAAPGRAEPVGGDETEALRAAKALFFDHKYAEARATWSDLLQGASADAAAYWIARCSENLGEHARAFAEYGAYLDRKPADRAQVEEARTSRVGLAVRLYKDGQKQHLDVARSALGSASKTVRYFAALQLASLGPEVGRPAAPVLREIVEKETDEDLVARARLALVRVDRAAPQPSAGPVAPTVPATRWIKIRIYEKGQTKPEVSVNMPVALAELVFKSLPDDARNELKRKGYDADNFWERLKGLAPTQILDINGDDGERIQIWLE